ncbi:MAG: hypothetical protein V8R99_04685, partial [Eubacterium ventriosum]
VVLIVVRLGCQIAIPFVNADMVAEVTSPFKEGGFSFLSAITGGSLEDTLPFASATLLKSSQHQSLCGSKQLLFQSWMNFRKMEKEKENS